MRCHVNRSYNLHCSTYLSDDLKHLRWEWTGWLLIANLLVLPCIEAQVLNKLPRLLLRNSRRDNQGFRQSWRSQVIVAVGICAKLKRFGKKVTIDVKLRNVAGGRSARRIRLAFRFDDGLRHWHKTRRWGRVCDWRDDLSPRRRHRHRPVQTVSIVAALCFFSLQIRRVSTLDGGDDFTHRKRLRFRQRSAPGSSVRFGFARSLLALQSTDVSRGQGGCLVVSFDVTGFITARACLGFKRRASHALIDVSRRRLDHCNDRFHRNRRFARRLWHHRVSFFARHELSKILVRKAKLKFVHIDCCRVLVWGVLERRRSRSAFFCDSSVGQKRRFRFIARNRGRGRTAHTNFLMRRTRLDAAGEMSGRRPAMYLRWAAAGIRQVGQPRHTGVFRKSTQSLVRPWVLILGGRLYGANIWVEYRYYSYLSPYTVRPTLYRVWILFVVATLYQWSANFFIAAQITFSIDIEGLLFENH